MAPARRAGSSSIASGWVPPITLTCAPGATQSASTSGVLSLVEVAVQMIAASATAAFALSPTLTCTGWGTASRTQSANCSALLRVRENTRTVRIRRTADTARTRARACTPAPITARSSASSAVHQRVARAATAPVRTAVSSAPSSRAVICPVVRSVSATIPWISGSPRSGLSGVSVVILTLPTPRRSQTAGLTSRTRWGPCSITVRAGELVRPAARSANISPSTSITRTS